MLIGCRKNLIISESPRLRGKGRYDEAVRTGAAWADKYPDTSNWIHEDISALYLRKAPMDSAPRLKNI